MENQKSDQKNLNSKSDFSREINLPKGGGTIQGMEGAFQLSEFSGSASFSLPVRTTPCRGASPQLNIIYGSNQGNGTWGLGWDSSSSRITRKTRQGIPTYQGEDNFLLNAEDLVPIGEGTREESLNGIKYEIKSYYERNEGNFSLIEYWCPRGFTEHRGSFWKITSSNHTISIYGKTSQAKLSDPHNPDHIFSWLLEEVYDTLGDHQLIFYKRENTENVDTNEIYEKNRTVGAQLYVERIRYGNKEPIHDSVILSHAPELSDASQWSFEVVYNYGEYENNNSPYIPVHKWCRRSDPFSTYSAGFEIRTYRLCQSVMMFHRFEELGSEPILTSETRFFYKTNKANINELIKATFTGFQFDFTSKTYKTASLPSTDIKYTPFDPKRSMWQELETSKNQSLPGVNNAPNYNIVDLFGEGTPGILYSNNFATYYRSRHIEFEHSLANYNFIPHPLSSSFRGNLELKREETLQYSSWQQLSTFPVERELANGQLTDVTNDGRIDIVINQAGVRGYWEVSSYQEWSPFRSFDNYPSPSSDQNSAWVDLTGNGFSDLVQFTNQEIRLYPSFRTGHWSPPILRNPPNDMPVNIGNTENIVTRFLDMAGSGQPQFTQVQQGKVTYWPSLGYGRFANGITMKNSPRFPEDYRSERIFFADLDGSGAMDIIYLGSDSAHIYLNENGNSFSDPFEISLPTHFSSLDQISFADVKGRGNSCLILSTPNGSSLPKHWCYDFCQGVKPYLVKEVDNNMGAITEITYGSSVDFYLKDKQAGLPWITTLPFPVQVVTKVTTRDEISGAHFTSHYSYHHGYYDGMEREFRGFGRVDRQDIDYPLITSENKETVVAPTLSRTWYHTGAFFDRDSLSRQFAKEYFQGDKEAFSCPDSVIEWGEHTYDNQTYVQAFTALAGTVLRSEIYALDNIEKSSCPYSISESNSCIRVQQPVGSNLYAVFLVYDREGFSYNYERNPADPKIDHSFTLKVDEFGNTLLDCSVAYGRRDVEGALPEQKSVKVLASTNTLTKENLDPKHYFLPVSYEGQSYHIPKLTPPKNKAFEFSEIKTAIEEAIQTTTDKNLSTDKAVLLGWSKTYFAEVTGKGTDALTKQLPLGAVPLAPLPLLIGREKTAEFSDAEVLSAFDGVLSKQQLKERLEKGYYEFGAEDRYWWSPSPRPEYLGGDCFYSLRAVIDPAGAVTTYDYDKYFLILIRITDALKSSTRVEGIDYQTLHPERMIDINDNTSEVSFDPLGSVIYTSHYGTENGKERGFDPVQKAPNLRPQSIDDIIKNPQNFLGNMQTYFYYDLFAWKDRKQPLVTLSLAAQNYPGEPEFPPQIALSYSDGFGRSLQVKTRHDPGESFLYDPKTNTVTKGFTEHRWLSSSRTIYNNKANPIRQYEPYFIDTPDFVSNETLDTFGYSDTLYYDPLGRHYKTLTAAGFLETHAWTPWEDIASDANDTIVDSPYYQQNINNPDLPEAERENLKYIAKYFYKTPVKSIHDNMGNTLMSGTIRRSADDPESVLIQDYFTYDILGNQLTSADQRLQEIGQHNFITTYGMNGFAFKTISADGGTQWALINVFGNPIFSYDSRHVTITPSYDILQRVVHVHVQKPKSKDDPLKLDNIVEKMIYGDLKNKAENLNGQLKQHYDQAGSSTIHSMTMGGQVLSGETRVRLDYRNEADWSGSDFLPLLSPPYPKSATYDALGRIVTETDSDGNITEPIYRSKSGLLNQIRVAHRGNLPPITYIQDIEYNPKGQRKYLCLGNETTTNYTYDPKTDRVIHIETVNSKKTILQDLHYMYDPVGNVIQKQDAIPDTVYSGNQEVSAKGTYIYDSLYQLISGTGRQKKADNTQSSPKDNPLSEFKVHTNDNQQLENYIERYTYDKGGNLIRTTHCVNTSTASKGWTRHMVVADKSNRAVISTINGKDAPSPLSNIVDRYFDPHGNQNRTQRLHQLAWNYRDNLQKATVVQHEDGTEDAEFYVYDSTGQRVRKVHEYYGDQGKILYIKETLYLGSLEVRSTFRGPSRDKLELVKECRSLRISGVATYYHWTKGGNTESPITTHYHLSDHLGSNTIEVNIKGEAISYEEYSPYGETTLYIRSSTSEDLKHYRYSGQEKDSVTGFYYYGLRYYAPWLSRWLSTDPAGTIDGLNIYAFVGGNPVTMQDIGGMMRRRGGELEKKVKKKTNTPVTCGKCGKTGHNANNKKFHPKTKPGQKQKKIESFFKPEAKTESDIIYIDSESSDLEMQNIENIPTTQNITNEKVPAHVESLWFEEQSSYIESYSTTNRNYGVGAIKYTRQDVNLIEPISFDNDKVGIFGSGSHQDGDLNIHTMENYLDDPMGDLKEYMKNTLEYTMDGDSKYDLLHCEPAFFIHLLRSEILDSTQPINILFVQKYDACMKNCHYIFMRIVMKYPKVTIKALGHVPYKSEYSDGMFERYTRPYRKTHEPLIRKYSNIGGKIVVKEKPLSTKINQQTFLKKKETDTWSEGEFGNGPY